MLHRILLSVTFASLGLSNAAGAERLELSDSAVRLVWLREEGGWRMQSLDAKSDGRATSFGAPSGRYTFLFSEQAPARAPVSLTYPSHPDGFPEAHHKYITPRWNEAITAVTLNTAGDAVEFFPANGHTENGRLEFSHHHAWADIVARWSLDPACAGDIRVTLELVAKRDGWFSLASPTLSALPPGELTWGMVPGYFQGGTVEHDFVRAYGYGHGLPDRPVVVRERAASTLAPLLTNRAGVTLAVVPEPGTAADPWEQDRDTRQKWRLGLSHMNRSGELSATLYHPVLGEQGSHLRAGERRVFHFRYIVRRADWFEVLKHTAREIYGLDEFLAMKRPTRALTERLVALHDYVTDDRTSLWRTESFQGHQIGAQAYLGGVLGSDRDAMKNSDYGAMWMLARLTGDPRLTKDRLPFARNFKLVQQELKPGPFQGAATGQYYLSKARRFTEEWGNYVEPVALTYYAILDLGQILLFEPSDTVLRDRLRLGADRLLQWQRPDGSWEVAYDHETAQPMFRDLPDLRPTFYGLLVAYRVLGDSRYLEAARRGADWLIAQGVSRGYFLGVCGDTRFAPDFATVQIAQALLELHELSGDSRYREAGLAAARFYVGSIYTHPRATNQRKQAGGSARDDWEINQTGLSFEHGGVLGSANNRGPILLASHAGLFVRVAQLTGDEFYLALARAAAWGRDAFVDPSTSVASYYWDGMNRGAGPFPHHAWWQIGWIVDYLVAEANYRSGGAISFPRGFFAPKVGPHASYGFAPGSVFGRSSNLRWGRVATEKAELDSLVTESSDGTWRLIVLNNSVRPQTAAVNVEAAQLTRGAKTAWTGATVLDAKGAKVAELPVDSLRVCVPAAGLVVIVLR